MKLWDLRCIAIGFVMLCATGLAMALKPNRYIAEEGRIDLEQMIPAEFAGWRIDRSVSPVAVSPDVQAKLDKIYSQVLSRTYVDQRGERIMLSIAYGGDQSDGMRAHHAKRAMVVSEPLTFCPRVTSTLALRGRSRSTREPNLMKPNSAPCTAGLPSRLYVQMRRASAPAICRNSTSPCTGWRVTTVLRSFSVLLFGCHATRYLPGW